MSIEITWSNLHGAIPFDTSQPEATISWKSFFFAWEICECLYRFQPNSRTMIRGKLRSDCATRSDTSQTTIPTKFTDYRYFAKKMISAKYEPDRAIPSYMSRATLPIKIMQIPFCMGHLRMSASIPTNFTEDASFVRKTISAKFGHHCTISSSRKPFLMKIAF